METTPATNWARATAAARRRRESADEAKFETNPVLTPDSKRDENPFAHLDPRNVPLDTHIAAHPVVPLAPPAPPPAVPGPAPVGPAAPPGGGGAGNGEPSAMPGMGGPSSGLPSGLLSGLPLLGTLVSDLPSSVDVSQLCVVADQVFAEVPCDKLPPGTLPPVTGVGGTP